MKVIIDPRWGAPSHSNGAQISKQFEREFPEGKLFATIQRADRQGSAWHYTRATLTPNNGLRAGSEQVVIAVELVEDGATPQPPRLEQ